jgi:hypothetical protein
MAAMMMRKEVAETAKSMARTLAKIGANHAEVGCIAQLIKITGAFVAKGGLAPALRARVDLG